MAAAAGSLLGVPADELSQGAERGPVPRSVRIAVATVLAVGLLGWAVLGRDGHRAAAPNPSASATPSRSVPIGPPLLLEVTERCPPVLEGSGQLVLAFTIANATDVPADLLGVAPLLPVGGLTPAGTTLAGGTCANAVPDPPATLVAGGAVVRVTFRFDLPSECAWPYPVQATTRVRADTTRSSELPLYADLGSIPLPGCPGD